VRPQREQVVYRVRRTGAVGRHTRITPALWVVSTGSVLMLIYCSAADDTVETSTSTTWPSTTTTATPLEDGTDQRLQRGDVRLGFGIGVGTLVLVFGWMGFNPGSTFAGADLRIAVVAVNTLLAGCFGTVTAMAWTNWKYGKPDISMSCNGMLAGLVAITAPCAFVAPWAACLIGLIKTLRWGRSCGPRAFGWGHGGGGWGGWGVGWGRMGYGVGVGRIGGVGRF
jgi:hypothetical protein